MTSIPAALNPTAASAGPALTDDQMALILALELTANYIEHAMNCAPIGHRAEGLIDEARAHINEALAAARSTEGGRT